MPRVTLALLVLLSGFRPLYAQVSPVPEDRRFNTEIVVTPERGATPRGEVPAATVVIEAAELATLPTVAPSEMMAFVPGFHVVRPQIYAGRPVVSARGFFGGGEAEYVRLFVDGLPVADAESGLIDWSAIPASSIRRVEASRGPGASLYGDAAIGGVIQIFTNRATPQREFTATGGSFQTFTVDLAFAQRYRRVGLNFSAAGRRTEGGYDHSATEQMLVAGAADGSIGGVSWRWSASGDTRDSDDPGPLARDVLESTPYASDPIFHLDAVDRQTFSTAFVLRHSTSAWAPQGRLYTTLRDEDLVRTIPLVPGLADTRARVLSASTVGGSLEAEHQTAFGLPVVTRFGIDLSREQINTTYHAVTENGDPGGLNSAASGYRLRLGLFVSTSLEATSRVQLVGGVRWDNVNDEAFEIGISTETEKQRAWSPRGGVVVRLADRGAVRAFGQVSRAFKAATLDQLYDPRPYPDFQGGTFTISNPQLVPQRATNLEAGLSGGGRLEWSILAYRMHVDDEIDFDARTFTYANIGESRHTGVELEARGQAGRYAQPFLTYALARVTNVRSDLQLKNVPRHVLTLGSSVDLPWRIGIFARYRASWGAFIDEDNLLEIDGASVVDLRVRRPFGRHSVFADVMNLTADHFEEYGFTLTSFTGDVVPYAYPGAPRAARIGMTLVF